MIRSLLLSIGRRCFEVLFGGANEEIGGTQILIQEKDGEIYRQLGEASHISMLVELINPGGTAIGKGMLKKFGTKPNSFRAKSFGPRLLPCAVRPTLDARKHSFHHIGSDAITLATCESNEETSVQGTNVVVLWSLDLSKQHPAAMQGMFQVILYRRGQHGCVVTLSI
jgi:hypothetical protein